MSTFTAIIPSGSTNGRQILVDATSSPGTTIHTAHATSLDEVWIWATNNHTSAVDLTIELGGTTSPDDLIQASIPSKTGPYLLVAGVRLTGSVVVKAFAGTTNVISIAANVNRIS